MGYTRFLTQDEQQLLGTSQGEHRDQAASFLVDDVMDRVTEASFTLLPLFMDVGAVGRLLRKIHSNIHIKLLSFVIYCPTSYYD